MGSGGIRIGAGRPDYRVKAENCLDLDIRQWKRDGALVPGLSGSWRWTETATGRSLGVIGYRVQQGRVDLNFAIGGKPIAQTVWLDNTPCTYGGSRPWFICPVRGERVAVLYLRGERFACRHCQRIAYGSQSDDLCGRAWRKQRKAEAKLEKGWARPKGMHAATRVRLLAIIFDCEERRDDALAAYVAGVMRRHPSLAGDLKL